MIKSAMSEKGGTLMLVFGFIVMISIVVAPLAMSTSVGLLQAKTNANSEKAFTEAHSGMTVFARMYEEMRKIGEANNTKANIENLVQTINNMSQFNVRAEMVSKNDNPIAVTFEADFGVGNQVRDSKVTYVLDPIYTPPPVVVPTSTPGPTPTPTPPAPQIGSKVILKNVNNTSDNRDNKNNKVFAACYMMPATGQPLPLSNILNDFTDQQFKDWFEPTADHYLNQSSSAIAGAFQNVFLDSRFSQPAALTSTVTSSDVSKYKTGPAIINAGNVHISGAPNTTITQDAVISADSSGNSVVANGDLYFKDIVNANLLFIGDVRVGGDLRFRQINSGKSITFNKNVIVKGNVNIGEGTNETIVIEGDLIVGGNLTVTNTLKKFVVKGNLIVNGDINISNTILEWNVIGSMLVKGGLIVTNGIASFDVKEDVIVQGNMRFTNPIAESRNGVPGLFSIGGSLKVKGLVEFTNVIHGFLIGKDVIVSNDLLFHNVLQSNFQVSGSIFTKGNFLIKNTINDFNVLGNVVVEGSFTAENTLERAFYIKGSLVTKGNMGFQNTIKSNTTIKIGENLISKTNLTFGSWTLEGSLDIGGMLLVFKDAALHDMKKDWHSNQVKGFYVGGTTYFYSQYAESWYLNDLDSGRRQESICIK